MSACGTRLNSVAALTAAAELSARFVQLDVTDESSVVMAMDVILAREGRLDILVNNAGITDNTIGVEGVSGAMALTVFNTNLAGVVSVTQAALPLLRASQTPVIVNLPSGLGSFGANTDLDRPESETPLIVYAASKAAVCMLTLKYAQALPDFKVNAAAPGFTATDFTADFGGGQPVEDAVDVIVRLATLSREGPTGIVEENRRAARLVTEHGGHAVSQRVAAPQADRAASLSRR